MKEKKKEKKKKSRVLSSSLAVFLFCRSFGRTGLTQIENSSMACSSRHNSSSHIEKWNCKDSA